MPGSINKKTKFLIIFIQLVCDSMASVTFHVLLLLFASNQCDASLLSLWTELFNLDQIGSMLSSLVSNGRPPLPESRMTTLEIIEYYGYPWERHSVATEDGYLLEMHRIPPSKNRANRSKLHPVFLQHGFIGSSAHFVVNGRKDSLAFILADEGYDVWMGNLRGNVYSRRHLRLSPDQDAFWNFSLDEFAILDLPAMMDHILKTTQQSELNYVGHSMGTTISAMFLSKRKDYCTKLRKVIWLAPVMYGTYAKTALRILTSSHQQIRSLLDFVYGIEVLWAPRWLKEFASDFSTTSTGVTVFQFLLGIIVGFSEKLLNAEYLPALINHGLEGTSWIVIKHFAQIFNDGKMTSYDWRSEKSYFKYSMGNRIQYNISDIDCPIDAFWGRMDTFTDPSDFDRLKKDLKQVTIEEMKGGQKIFWSHLDFIFSKNLRSNFYNQLVNLISRQN